MPLPLIIAGLSALSGAAGVAAQFSANRQNVAAQERINQQNINAQHETNALARKWALEDYASQNKYNSPIQQMQRLREAGLNPNLVYGSGAQSTAAMVRSTNPGAPQATPPRMAPLSIPDFGGPLAQMYDLQLRQADLKNREAQNALLLSNVQKNDLAMAGMGIKNAQSQFSLEQAKKLQDSTLEAARLKNLQTIESTRKTSIEADLAPLKYDLSKQEFALKKAKTKSEIESINADIIRKSIENSTAAQTQKQRALQELQNLRNTGQLQHYDLVLRSMGLNPSDPSYVRIITQLGGKLLEKLGYNVPLN